MTELLALIERIHKNLDKHDIPFVLLIMPQEQQLNSEKLSELLDPHNIEKNQRDIEKFQRILNTYSEKRNISTIDPLHYFQENNGSYPYFQHGSHFNHHGHGLMAEYMYQQLISQSLI